MTDVTDITPEHRPERLLKDLLPEARKATAAVVILLSEDDELYVQRCGVTGKDLLWALEFAKHRMLHQDD